MSRPRTAERPREGDLWEVAIPDGDTLLVQLVCPDPSPKMGRPGDWQAVSRGGACILFTPGPPHRFVG